MDSKKVLIKFMDDENRWRIFWSCTTELADPRSFATIDEAAPVARALMGYVEPRKRGPELKLIIGTGA